MAPNRGNCVDKADACRFYDYTPRLCRDLPRLSVASSLIGIGFPYFPIRPCVSQLHGEQTKHFSSDLRFGKLGPLYNADANLL